MNYRFYILAALFLMLGAGSLSAQKYYTLSYSTGTYTPLNVPEAIPGLDTNDYYIDLQNFQMQVYGFTMMPPAQNSAIFFRQGYVVFPTLDGAGNNVLFVIEAFYSLLTPRDATSGRYVTVELQGGAPVLKFEWRNMGLQGHPASDFVNFQLWLNVLDNSVEMHMGPNQVTAKAGYIGTQSGPMIGLNIMSSSLDQTYHTLHLTGAADKPVAREVAVATVNGTPQAGMIYRFAYEAPASVSTGDHAVSGVSFHPNPFRESTQIELPDDLNGTATMVVHDLLGREMYRMEKATSGDHIPRGSLPAGVYLVTLQDKGRSRFGGRLVVTE